MFANCETSDKFARIYSSLILTNFVDFVMFHHFRNEQRTVPDMCPAAVLNLGLLLGHASQLRDWSLFITWGGGGGGRRILGGIT